MACLLAGMECTFVSANGAAERVDDRSLRLPKTSRFAWKQRVESAVKAARAQVSGAEQIDHYWHGRLVTLMLEAFGDEPDAYFFIETFSPRANIPRPDLVMLHPQVGVLVVENKGIDLPAIESVRGAELTIQRDGVLSREDPLRQAERVMFGIRDLCKERVDVSRILFLRIAVLPAIHRKKYEERFSITAPADFLFAEECATAGTLREVVVRLANEHAPAHIPSRRLSREDSRVVISALTGQSILRADRSSLGRSPNAARFSAEIRAMEDALREPTEQQKSLGNADLSGSHRLFRGVAGSGKSILLAMNAAQAVYDLSQREGNLFEQPVHRPRVLVLCYNRTLTFYLRQRIEERYKRIAWSDVPEDCLIVTHVEGLIYNLVKAEPSLQTPYTYEDRPARAELMCRTLDQLPPDALASLQFDYIYVDETQDLYPEELQFIRRLARCDENGRQTLILFYDNAQNIYGVKTPVWEKLGIQIVGRTIFLDQCLRNTRQVVDFAFNVLVGSYADAGKPVTTRQFADVANLLQRGLIREDGPRFDIEFCRRHGAAPRVEFFASRREEIKAVAEYVRHLLHVDGVMPSDILILSKHYKFMDGLEEALTGVLGHHGSIRFVDAEHPENKRKPLFDRGILTLCTVASAKGYDAPVVFVMGADDFHADDKGRASFYVACTRAKLALIVTGVRRLEGGRLIGEIEKAAAAVRQRRKPVVKSAVDGQSCPHCQGNRLHAQISPEGFSYHCIDCLSVIPIDAHCTRCGGPATLKMEGRNLMAACPCGPDHLVFTNQPLARW